MTEPNQQSLQTDAAGRTELHDQGRFAAFSEDERCVLGDALRELLGQARSNGDCERRSRQRSQVAIY
jgi:hypothetical protein